MGKLLYQYRNGNCRVAIYVDGTKIRSWPDGEQAQPAFPESVDLKITNRCESDCAWCHESATEDGAQAPLDRIVQAIGRLPAGVELALGGGNPLLYPDLHALLDICRSKGIISNMTVQQKSILFGYDRHRISTWQRDGFLHGVGVSGIFADDWFLANGVCHLIVGVDNPCKAISLRAEGYNVLLLGYKRYGRGADAWGEQIQHNISAWRYFIDAILGAKKSLEQPRGVLSFDNLALKQLCIRSLVSAKVWARHYMGDDGQFTMYFDAVKNEYAASSVGIRYDAGAMTLGEMFGKLQYRY